MGKGNHSETLLLLALFYWSTPSCLKVIGGNVQAAMWWVAHKTLLSSPVPIWIGIRGLGLGLDNYILRPAFEKEKHTHSPQTQELVITTLAWITPLAPDNAQVYLKRWRTKEESRPYVLLTIYILHVLIIVNVLWKVLLSTCFLTMLPLSLLSWSCIICPISASVSRYIST